MELSWEPEANLRPSGEKTTLNTILLCPSRVCSNAPLCASHNRMVLSSYPDASLRPAGEK